MNATQILHNYCIENDIEIAQLSTIQYEEKLQQIQLAIEDYIEQAYDDGQFTELLDNLFNQREYD